MLAVRTLCLSYDDMISSLCSNVKPLASPVTHSYAKLVDGDINDTTNITSFSFHYQA